MRDLPSSGIEPVSLRWQADSSTTATREAPGFISGIQTVFLQLAVLDFVVCNLI